MKTQMLRNIMAVACCGFIASATAQDKAVPATETQNTAAAKDDRAKIQIALLLVTSSSMDGLIDQARSYPWKSVNELTLATKNGKPPKIEIALFDYGNSNLPE